MKKNVGKSILTIKIENRIEAKTDSSYIDNKSLKERIALVDNKQRLTDATLRIDRKYSVMNSVDTGWVTDTSPRTRCYIKGV